MSAPETPQRLVAGRYRLRKQLGQGSMGTVWEAYDEFLRRPVAVKQVRLPADDSPAEEIEELRERTLREARAIAVVSHPNVITLHDVAREGDEPFVVMEFVVAASLAELVSANGPLDVEQAAIVGHAVAAGLSAAHAAGVVHRDVKPGNVLVSPDGMVKLTDFGIARNLAERTLTSTGIMLGSPCYIAPEIASGGAVTPRADLWGLGATLFAAVEGHAPYDAEAPAMEIVSQVVNGEVPQPAHDGPLREVIIGLMAKDPDARMSLREVRDRLHPLMPAPGSPVYDSLRLDPTPPEDARTVITKPYVSLDAPTETSPPLAQAPGPLPFHRPGARRSRGTAVALGVVSVVLFACAAVGGFALTRSVAGQPLLPVATPAASQQAAAPLRELVVRTADAATLAGEQGGSFSVPVPGDWVKFVEQRTARTLPNSTRVHWVSPDGTSEIVIERFPNFYPKHTIEQYLRVLDFRTPRYRAVGSTPLDRTATEQGLQLTYRAVDVVPPGSPGSDVNRTSIANILPTAKDLWVVSVTVPIDQEDTGRRGLFARIAPEFRVLSRS
ncbi:serine/threonine protein kinase [Actinokineospora cianjurensis]|uniref:non-specific serine/threonine protein kinase n=1 Tax=Actinokineospora cianjurensis TaxID=585224 RepID=A0A421B9W2_9PSEU|nr:serine/threonine-protein kinase [Actinokineospora cianjurensis]RLK60990.1 serine/threonine protein kinase [Actinokineospora cianjurensis]